MIGGAPAPQFEEAFASQACTVISGTPVPQFEDVFASKADFMMNLRNIMRDGRGSPKQ